jgi:hypothetical protein
MALLFTELKTHYTRPDHTYRGNGMPLKPRIGAVILIVLGVLFLLSNLGLIPRLAPLFAQWWPVILIAVGVSLLMRR